MSISDMIDRFENKEEVDRKDLSSVAALGKDPVLRYMIQLLYDSDREMTHSELRPEIEGMYRDYLKGKVADMANTSGNPIPYRNMPAKKREMEERIERGLTDVEYKDAVITGLKERLYMRTGITKDRDTLNKITKKGKRVYEMFIELSQEPESGKA